MLSYHPMIDPYHCSLRISSVAADINANELEWDRVRLIDFYVAFPSLMTSFKFPQSFIKAKASFRELPSPYENIANASRLFFQIGEIQSAAARLLAGRGILSDKALLDSKVVLLSSDKLVELKLLLSKVKFRETSWYRELLQIMADHPLNGKGGLKDRSGLMEYRHDAI